MQRGTGADASASWAAIYLTIGEDADVAAVVCGVMGLLDDDGAV